MSNKFFQNQNRGFTLIEVMVAVFILVTGIVGAYGLVNYSLSMANDASMRLTAVYLAKEGIEIARNIRDTNYVDRGGGNSWDHKLSGCDLSSGGCGADYSHDSLLPSCKYNNLFINTDGLYQCAATSNQSSYKRTIILTPQGSPVDKIKIDSKVEWTRAGRSNSITVSEELYNWWNL